MKILSIYINDLVDNKIDIICDWAVKNAVTNIYIFSNNTDRNNLKKIVSKLPCDVNVSFFLDSTSSYELSGKDIKEILKDRNDIKFISDMMVRFNYQDKVINLVNDLIEKEDLIQLIDMDSYNYNIFILRENNYEFNFKLISNVKVLYVSIPSLNDKNDFVLLETKNAVVIGKHLILKDNKIITDVLFKV